MDEGPAALSEATRADVGVVTVTVTIVECDSEALVPVTVTM